jgi:DNA-binding Lrp family transcriptional regulator
MLELSPARKNKVNLNDYNFQQDIENRILMSDFTTFDVKALEEILYSSLKISVRKLAKTLECDESTLLQTLKKLSKTGLLTVADDTILVDKEMRKYFEFEITRFEPDFRPDMEFLQGILRKVSIHLLPVWYSVPRTSNNIFESLIEKYLLTPQLYQRYLMELQFGHPTVNAIIHDIFTAPDFKISSSDLISKYNLNRKDFEEILLLLEFNFVGALCYEKEEDHWHEFVTPIQEWREYLQFLKLTEVPIVQEPVNRNYESDFPFIEEMSDLLHKSLRGPVVSNTPHALKLCMIKVAEERDGKLYPTQEALPWLEMTIEERALSLYRHPHNYLLSRGNADRYVREAEKSIKRVLHGSWVFFDDFLKSVLVPLSEKSVISLKKTGKQWRYTLPTYTKEEEALIKATIFEWLHETGVVVTGTCQGRDCFAVTPFGRFFFQE